jgi:hypothetical protein
MIKDIDTINGVFLFGKIDKIGIIIRSLKEEGVVLWLEICMVNSRTGKDNSKSSENNNSSVKG